MLAVSTLLLAILLVLIAILLTLSPLTRRILRWLGIALGYAAAALVVVILIHNLPAIANWLSTAPDPKIALRDFFATPLGWTMVCAIDSAAALVGLYAVAMATVDRGLYRPSTWANFNFYRPGAWAAGGRATARRWRSMPIWDRFVILITFGPITGIVVFLLVAACVRVVAQFL
jgi:hypothetical protein